MYRFDSLLVFLMKEILNCGPNGDKKTASTAAKRVSPRATAVSVKYCVFEKKSLNKINKTGLNLSLHFNL